MSAEAALELRVLTGIHAGARTCTPARFSIGADPECDVILTDAGVALRHADITVNDDHWIVVPLQPVNGIPAEGARFRPGAKVAFGPVWISVDAANAPWQGDAPDAPDAGVSDLDAGIPLSADMDEQSPTGRKSGSSKFTWTWRVVLIVAGLIVIAGIAIGIAHLRAPATTASTATSASTDHAPRAATGTAPVSAPAPVGTRPDQSRIMAILKQGEWTSRLKVMVQHDGNLLVTGRVKDDAEFEQIADALSRVQPRPAFKVQSDEELLTGIRAVLARHGKGLKVDDAGDDGFQLSGIVSIPEQRAAIAREVSEEVGSAVSIENDIRLPDALVEQFSEELRSAGLNRIEADWTQGGITLSGEVPESALTRLEKLLLSFNDRVASLVPVVPLRARIRTIRLPDAQLPFAIRSIVDGAIPRVVLADGNTILMGGNAHGYRLAGITDSEIIFEGPRRVAYKR